MKILEYHAETLRRVEDTVEMVFDRMSIFCRFAVPGEHVGRKLCLYYGEQRCQLCRTENCPILNEE